MYQSTLRETTVRRTNDCKRNVNAFNDIKIAFHLLQMKNETKIFRKL